MEWPLFGTRRACSVRRRPLLAGPVYACSACGFLSALPSDPSGPLWLHEIKHESRFGDKPSKEMSVLMRRKEVERRSRKYAAVQNVSVIGWYTDAEEFHQKYKTRRAVDKKHMSSSPSPGLARGRKKERSSLESACDELIDKGAIITGEWWAVCVRSWPSSSSDRGLVDPQSPLLPRPINDTS
jgi:hypothetical protein